MKKEQMVNRIYSMVNRINSTHIEDLYVKRIIKRAVRRFKCKGIRLIIRKSKESALNIDWL
jgi:hypothetical protein